MPTVEEYQGRSIEERLSRLQRTPGELESAIAGKSDAELGWRPDARNWSAKEIVCHLRDVEREYIERFHLVLENDAPKIYMEPDGNERWPVDLQYHRNDTADAASAFRRLRDEMTTLLSGLTAGELQRGGIHPRRGRVTIDSWVAMLVVHDADHSIS